MKVLLLLSIAFQLSILVNCRRECISRAGLTSNYCVCNQTYCDDLEPITKQDVGSVLLFQTSKRGDRFKQIKLKFEKNQTSSNGLTLTIDRTKKFQSIIGFGGAFTDASGLNLNTLPKEMANNVMKDYFSDTGIQYNMGRVPIAGCDFSPRPYTYADTKDDFTLSTFKLQKEDIDYKFPYIKEAVKLSKNKTKLFASPWSAPAWMKDNKELNHGGKLIGKPGEKYYKIWANYFVKFLDAYKSNGVNFWGLTVENEPGAGFVPDYKFNSLGFDAPMERDFVKLDLGPALTKAGYGRDQLTVMAYDDGRNHPMVDWINTVFNDSEAAKYLNGIAYHCYDNGLTSWDVLDKVHAAQPNQFLLSTECCQGFAVLPKGKVMRLGVWESSESYAKDIMLNLQHWVTGWVEWNYALDMYGQPNWAGFSSEAPILINATANEYYKDPKFYVLGQFSKFLEPNSVRVSLTMTEKSGVNAVAFVRPDNSTVVIVYNFNKEPIDLVINDSLNGKLLTTIPEHSVQSYIYFN